MLAERRLSTLGQCAMVQAGATSRGRAFLKGTKMIADFRRKLLASTLLVGTAAYANPAFAQTVTPPATSPEAQQATVEAVTNTNQRPEQEIVVTGSRIARPDLDSSSPVAVVSSKEFQLTAGSANVENVLNNLPQVTATTSSTSNNPGGGVATVNLRGLGSQRTLVLVNSRRYVSFDVNQIVDTNTIPASLIDRVDVVTGGASAVYGSDAIAGVVNFILKKNFSGIQADGGVTVTDHGDGQIYDAGLTFGSNFDDGRGNVTLFAGYTQRKPTFAGQRGFSFNALSDNEDGSPPFAAGGSPSVPQGRVNIPGLGAATGLGCNNQDFAGNVNSCFLTADAYNFSPVNYLQVPQDRYVVMGMANYEINEHVKPYTELTFINNRVDAQLAATPISQGTPFGAGTTGPIQLNTHSPFFTPAFQAALQALDTDGNGLVAAPSWAFRTTQLGPRANFDDRNAYRILGGVAGNLLYGWDYDASYMFARTKNAQRQLGNVAISNFLAATTNVFLNPTTGATSALPFAGVPGGGTLVCADAAARAAGCVPANIFGLNNLSPEAVNYLGIGATNLETYSTQVANVTFTNNNLFDLGMGGGGVGVALGAEWRKESGAVDPDQFLASGNVAGFNPGQATRGSYTVREFFGETRIPILKNSFLYRFELNGAARFSHYNNAPGSVFTWAAGAELAPIRDLTFRGNYQKAIRGPSINELFLGNTVSFAGNADSCGTAAAVPAGPLHDICVAQFTAAGAPLSSIGNPAIQDPNVVNPVTFLGGNANLREETAKTWTLGAILQPTFLPGFSATVDYYHIDISNYIVPGIGTQVIGNLCFTQHIQQYCDTIQRNSIGEIDSFRDLFANTGGLKTRGVDVSASYNHGIGQLFGNTSRIGFNFNGTYLIKNDLTPVVSQPDVVIRCAGKFGANCGAPTPHWKHQARVSLSSGPVTLSGNWRYIGSANDDDPDTLYGSEHFNAVSYFDLTALFNVGEHYELGIGVSNIFDKKPPLAASTQNGGNGEQSNTFPTVYDVLGRTFFANARLKF